MAERHFLYLGSTGLQIARLHRRQLSLESHFEPADGQTALATWLQEHPRARCTLLVDLPDESYHLETLPLVGPRDRRQLIARRQAQLRLETPYITHQPLGRAIDTPAGGAPQEKILFAALNRPATLQACLATFQQRQRPIDGVSLLAHLAADLAPQLTTVLPAGLPPVALVVWTSPAGLRVSCLDGGRLRFSRLTPANTGTGTDPWHLCHDEIRRTHQYLIGQRAIERGHPTQVFVLAHPRDHAALGSACADRSEFHVEAIDLPALATRCGLHSTVEDSDSLPLLLHLASRSRHLPQLVPPSLRGLRHRFDPVTALGALVTSILAISLVISTNKLLEARRLRQQADSTLTESLAEEAQARSLQGTTPLLPLTADILQADFARLTALQPFSARLTAFLHHLADALETLPGVELSTLEWSLTPDTPHPAISAVIELRLPATSGARPDLSQHVVTTIHRHTGNPANSPTAISPDDASPLRSPGGKVDTDGRQVVRLELPVNAR